MSLIQLDIATPRWSVPLLAPARYKGAKGGRGSGKSHFFAEALVERCVADPDLPVVCIREVQKSLKFSAKRLIEAKIRKLGVSGLFDIQSTEIRRIGGDGIIIFQGMQDHTADSIKSLEGFKISWVEEAQRLSARSLKLLRPTIRAEDSEMWFSWNPDLPTDPIDEFFASNPKNSVCIHVNYDDNPFFTDILRDEMDHDRRVDIDAYNHIWLGHYNTKSDAQIFAGKIAIDEFEPASHWSGPYFGADWGFSVDPTALVRFWIDERSNRLYIEYEAYGHRVDIDQTPALFDTIPGVRTSTIRADNARPETINYMQKRGFNIIAADKWKGSVEDGISWLRSFEKIVIHERCRNMQDEARLYSWKMDKLTGDPTPDIMDKWNHLWDALRYGAGPMIQDRVQGFTEQQIISIERYEKTTLAPSMDDRAW